MPPRQPTSDELRTYFAGQRTLLAWIRTSVALMGFGFLVARFGLFLQQISQIEHLTSVGATGFSRWMGTVLVILGSAVNVLAAARHREFLRQFSETDLGRLRTSLFETGLAIVLSLVGISMAVYLVTVQL
ncbi:MAG: YidH family protein [Planctomycetaceae bacterium]